MCNAPGASRCSGCRDAAYCSSKCQKDDWKTHQVLCKQYLDVAQSPRPSPQHFLGLIFPHEESAPQFLWIEARNETQLLAHHSAIDSWKTKMKDRYKSGDSDSDPVVIHALSGDRGLKGKRFGHGLRVVFWPPPSGDATDVRHLEDFNLTVFSLSRQKNASNIPSLKYGPLIAFAYTLDSKFDLESLVDASTSDLRHVIDYFRHSHWNPTVGDVTRFQNKAIPSLYIPDTSHILTKNKGSKEACTGGLTAKMGVRIGGLRQMIPARINSHQACFHVACDQLRNPIPNMCLSGSIWHTFLIGPLMLGLPWVGRNSIVADIHAINSRSSWPSERWKTTGARFLRQSMHAFDSWGYLRTLDMTDGLILFHAFGEPIRESHLEAYDQFILQNERRKGRPRPYTKAEFSKFWDDWKKNKALVAEEKPDSGDPTTPEEYRALPSPYHITPGATSVLAGDMTHMLECLTKSFDNQEFRADFSQYESKVFKAEMLLNRWEPPRGFTPYHYEYQWGRDYYEYEWEREKVKVEGGDEAEVGADVGGGSRNLNGGDGQANVPVPTATAQQVDLAALATAGLSLMDP